MILFLHYKTFFFQIFTIRLIFLRKIKVPCAVLEMNLNINFILTTVQVFLEKKSFDLNCCFVQPYDPTGTFETLRFSL